MDTGIASRIDALRILFRWMTVESFPNRQLADVLPERRGFVMELVYATVRWVRALDAVLAPRLRHQPSAEAEAALLLGACQLLKLPGIPAYAAVHATVEALKQVAGQRTPLGLVNAVLRDVERNREGDLRRLDAAPLAIRTSHPDALVARWTERWGAARAAAICDWNNLPADVTVLPLPRGPDAAALLARFRAAGLDVKTHPDCPEGLVLGHGVRVEALPGFGNGDFAIQDPATLDAVRLLDVRPGQRVLDACAAPGGKAARIARLLGARDRLVAVERHADRLPALRETLARLAAEAPVDIRQADATEATVVTLGGAFDRVLLDVPCSNTGVLRRRPDARWRAEEPARAAQRQDVQARLLARGAALLAPGGRLVYSTCSLEREENEAQIERFLGRHADFRLVATNFRLPPGTDGAFAAALERAS